MSDLSKHRRVLTREVRETWPLLATAVENIEGHLVGGTALATRLQHRKSFDLDFMAHEPFSGADLFKQLSALADHAVCTRAEQDRLFAAINNVAVEVFTAPRRGEHPGHVNQLAPSSLLAGMRVASLPDLLAMKMDVVMYRPKLRDYMDLAAIDNHGHLKLEDGLLLHMRRYGTQPQSAFLDQLVDRLERPGRLPDDPEYADQSKRVLDYLANRVPALRSHVARLRKGVQGIGNPQPRSAHAGLLQTIEVAPSTPSGSSAASPVCGHETPTGPCKSPKPSPTGRCAAGHQR